jgi:hypothetical protein
MTNLTINQNPGESINKRFTEDLTKLFNEYVLLNYPNVKTFDIEQGFFTSGQYGSYRVPCYNKDKVMECYIICDVILGDYKVYKGKL